MEIDLFSSIQLNDNDIDTFDESKYQNRKYSKEYRSKHIFQNYVKKVSGKQNIEEYRQACANSRCPLYNR